VIQIEKFAQNQCRKRWRIFSIITLVTENPAEPEQGPTRAAGQALR
jgi:hypothetical protein